jgi:hypothetical protein
MATMRETYTLHLHNLTAGTAPFVHDAEEDEMSDIVLLAVGAGKLQNELR